MIAFAGAAGLDRFNVPDRAASRLKGSDAEVLLREEKDGGSMRVKGAETRRFLSSTAFFALGERPAGAVSGARGEEILAFALCRGVAKEVCTDDASIVVVLAKERVGVVDKEKEGLIGVLSLHLLRLLGERKMEGSTFSLSKSSKVDEGIRRLVVDPGVVTVTAESGLFS